MSGGGRDLEALERELTIVSSCRCGQAFANPLDCFLHRGRCPMGEAIIDFMVIPEKTGIEKEQEDDTRGSIHVVPRVLHTHRG